MLANAVSRSIVLIEDPLSVRKTWSAPLMPALATTMSILPEGDSDNAVLNAAS